jgi:hypothetical protein
MEQILMEIFLKVLVKSRNLGGLFDISRRGAFDRRGRDISAAGWSRIWILGVENLMLAAHSVKRHD